MKIRSCLKDKTCSCPRTRHVSVQGLDMFLSKAQDMFLFKDKACFCSKDMFLFKGQGMFLFKGHGMFLFKGHIPVQRTRHFSVQRTRHGSAQRTRHVPVQRIRHVCVQRAGTVSDNQTNLKCSQHHLQMQNGTQTPGANLLLLWIENTIESMGRVYQRKNSGV